ncbi:MAG TPA: proteasome subunit alpha [Acidimicrobiia bacterium]|jgi:proteasome alpha subunit|nr:proteasome subunit alpha [Acidimicrobiia bacterium]
MTAPFYVPPEQLIKDRADFARKGIARGRPIVVLEYADGVLLIGENPSGSLHKLGEIYDRIAFAGVGRFNEFESMRVGGVRYADVKGYSYARADVTSKGLANAYSQTLGQVFTHEVKPYEIEVMIAEVGETPADTEIYRIQFDGNLASVERFGAMGGGEQELTEALEARYEPGLDLAAAIALAVDVIEGAGDGSIASGGWEAAVLDRTRPRRKFLRLAPDEIEAARGAS